MKSFFQLTTVETTYETEAKGWTYRFISSARGVMVKRTSTKDLLWSHGGLTQVFNAIKIDFVGAHTCSATYFSSLEDAQFEIEAFVHDEVKSKK